MESTSYRHRRSPSSDRFLSVFSFSPPSSAGVGGGDELNEAEVFWTNDFTDVDDHYDHDRPRLTNKLQKSASSGILAALPETDNRSRNFRDGPVLCRKPTISAIPTIPRRPERELSQALNCNRKFQNEQNQSPQLHLQSAPMKVPVLSKAMAAKNRNGLIADDVATDDLDEDEMLPPHEIVARGSGVSPKTTFSVLEGVGRTLKGRDLRQVRNAIWRKTGFLD
nr:uncharacterized protein LOC111996792 [Quercus suber]POE70437.1 hypothetical protein CFP56_35591 [Quercus suber]